MTADINDIKMELWLRARESGELKWITKEGDIIPLKDLSTSHLLNIHKMLEKHEEYVEIQNEYFAYIDDLDQYFINLIIKKYESLYQT